jgi:hypothetical protein
MYLIREMPGGLMQLVNKGAQDQLVTGSPSFTHFRSVYKRHTEFAMEHFRLNFRGTNLELNANLTKSFRVKVDRNAQLLHDCYVHVSLPDIFSPVNPVTPGLHPEISPDATAIGYEFQWIPNIGYNMINSVSVLVNGTAIVTHSGEWMKLYSYITHDANKRKIVDQMVGNVPELYDPANAYNRRNQYPHAISTTANVAQPSILGKDIVIPLHFWFCEDIGTALPLVALQYSEVEFVIEFAPIYDLFTVRDVRNSATTTFGKRIKADPSATEFLLNRFLGPPLPNGIPINPSLISWKLNPYIEATYIFLGDAEVVQLAKSDNSFKIKDIRVVAVPGVHGAGNDVELTLVNLCTRVVWVAQRSDVEANNGVDNYTNQLSSPYSLYTTSLTPWFSTGSAVGQNLSAPDILIDGTIMFDGAERFNTKTQDFFSLLENYSHHTGRLIPGINTYSFALDHHTHQPSGHVNGSMFNKTLLRLTLQDPPYKTSSQTTRTCVVKSTALNQRPVPVSTSRISVYSPDQVVSVIAKTPADVREFTYTVRAYVESYNFLRITRGIANVVFSS